jgi:hypothetical protein
MISTFTGPAVTGGMNVSRGSSLNDVSSNRAVFDSMTVTGAIVTSGNITIDSTEYLGYVGGTAAAPHALLVGPTAATGSSSDGGTIVIGQGAGSSTIDANARNMVIIGANAGASLNSGGNGRAVIIGAEAGQLCTSSCFANVFVGYRAGKSISNWNNVAIGFSAGMNCDPTGAVFIGSNAGSGSDGSSNVYIGNGAGMGSSSTGGDNIAIGTSAYSSSTSGSQNISIGGQAGGNLQDGAENVILGDNSGSNLTSGSRNVLLGAAANTGAAFVRTIALGYAANATANDQFAISDTVTNFRAVGLTSLTLPGPLLATSSSTPANPAGTTSATAVMMGLAGSLTPTTTGKVMITVDGTIAHYTAGTGATVRIVYGTGAAPVNGAAATGTALNAAVTLTATGSDSYPFCLTRIVTGLSLATAHWIDLSLLSAGGGTANVYDITISANELL